MPNLTGVTTTDLGRGGRAPADADQIVEDPVSLSLLRCGACTRRWLAAGDQRGEGSIPCPYCDSRAVGVLGVHR